MASTRKTRRRRRRPPTPKLTTLWSQVRARKGRQPSLKADIPVFLRGKSEKFFLEAVVRYFSRKGWMAYHHDTKNPRYSWIIGPGFPDLVLTKVIKGKKRTRVVTIFVELKLYGRYPDERQKKWMDNLPARRTFLWKTNNWRELKWIENRLSKALPL